MLFSAEVPDERRESGVGSTEKRAAGRITEGGAETAAGKEEAVCREREGRQESWLVSQSINKYFLVNNELIKSFIKNRFIIV